ncbi:MAG: transcription termination/antitermination protein NusG [Wolbachia endosymbiont of Tyrophagus putrescentiae]|nr:transcription termination/antitermination protein NusG [Wolbachia endosymbiont of Tyrophagus putrescentiae]
MTYEYKWYIIRVSYGCEQDICELVNKAIYFKDVFVPYQIVHSLRSSKNEEPLELYVYMHLCDESRAILNEISGFESDDFEVVSNDEIDLKRKEFDKYKWYILRVASNYEEKVRQHILENSMRLGVNDYFKELFIPYEELNQVESHSKKVVTRRKCFPGYIFLYVNLCDDVLNFISNIPKSLKVYGFLRDGSTPKVILGGEINSMCDALYTAQESKKLGCSYEKGEKVKINDGLFQNFIGKIEMINDEAKVVSVEVSILGKPTIIEFDINQVEKIED